MPIAPHVRLKAPEIAGETLVGFGASLSAHAAARPDHIAVIDDGVQWTWGRFHGMVARTAGRLAQTGVAPGVMVAAISDNSAEYLALYAAVLLAGGCMVPLPTGAHPDALRKMVAACDAPLLFASDRLMATAAGLGAKTLLPLDDLAQWSAHSAPLAPVTMQPDDPFDMIFSSGTTSTPKGILHDTRFRGRQLVRMPQFGLGKSAVLLMATPLYSNTTLVAVLPVLAQGGTVVSMAKFDPLRFLAFSQQHRVTHAMLVPVQYMRLMDFPDFDSFDLSSYQVKLSTSAPLPGRLIAQLMARWPGNLYELYGMTEGGVSTVLDAAAHPDKWDTVGRPAEGSDVRIIDETGNELPPGAYGEIVGRSGAMMPGYYKADDKTAEVIWRNAAGDDFIRTGDMGRFDADGFLHLLDRRKDMILSGGFNIYAADLEQVLRGHPDVADVAVIAVPSAKWGETPLGLVVLRKGAAALPGDICDWANTRLGNTQRLSAIEVRPDLPRSDIGKILKRELRLPYWPQQGRHDPQSAQPSPD